MDTPPSLVGTTDIALTPDMPAFDYASLGPHAETAELAALDIIEQLHKQMHAFGEIGRLLCDVKSKLAHGDWTSWLKSEIPFSERAAQNYMSIHTYLADDFGSLQHLKQSTVLKLASRNVPEDARKNIVAAARDGLGDAAVCELVGCAKAEKAGTAPSRATAPDPLAEAVGLIVAAVPDSKLGAIIEALAKARQKTLSDKLRKALRDNARKKGNSKAS